MKKRHSDNNNSAYALVYSTDPQPKVRCKGCLRPQSECVCPPQKFPTDFKPATRMERAGRGGKTVTVIFKLPAHETMLKDLCGFLKKSTGGGGTFYTKEGEGFIELQGDRREQILDLIEKYKARKNTK